MAYRQRFNRYRFRAGRVPRATTPVSRKLTTLKKKTKCAACKAELPAGTLAVVLRLRKAWKKPCSGCGKKPSSTKRYHDACCPADIAAAMGVDASAPPPASTGGACAPPPIPPTPLEAALSAMVVLEQALTLRLSRNAKAWTIVAGKRVLVPEIEKAFKTYQGLKARALRPGTEAEGDQSASVAIQRLVKLVYAD